MALHTLIALTAAIAGGTAQDPSMDFQIATPVLTDSEVVPQQAVASVAVTQDNKVTAQFRNAKATEVLEWIEKRGINFVVNDGDIKPDAKVTLSVTDVPLETVLDSLASALGGHWERRNNVRVFRKGAGLSPFYGTASVNGLRGVPAVPGAPMNLDVRPFMKMDGKAFQGKAFDGKVFEGKAFDKDFEKRMKEMGAEMEKKFGPEFHKKLEESMKEMRVYTLGEDHKLRQLQGKEREEAMKRVEIDRKEALKLSAEARKEALKMSEEARKFATEARKEALKEAERARAEGQRARSEGQRARVEGQRAREEALRSFNFDSNTRVYRLDPTNRDGRRSFITPSFPVDGMDMGKFLKSLSSNQKDTQSKRGYIRYDDLTRDQKRLLGVRPDGKFEIRLKVNQNEVVVRGE